MQTIKEFIDKHQNRMIEELVEFLKIPSVSADPTKKDAVLKASMWLKDHIEDLGVNHCEIFPTAGHPIVYAHHQVDPDLPTILIYGHYDVQPPDPVDLWDSPPFEPVIKKTDTHPDGAIYARGACDDKGQLFMHLKALEFCLSRDQMPCNIKILLEGEEEVGSENLYPFVENHKEMLSCDMVLVSDTSIIANDTPSITTGLRGM